MRIKETDSAGNSSHTSPAMTLELRKENIEHYTPAKTYNLPANAARELMRTVEEVLSQEDFEVQREESITAWQEAMLALRKLSEREKEVMQWIVEGLTNRQIAEKLYVSPKTIDNHRTRLMKKLGVHNAAELVRWAMNYQNKTG